VAAAVGASSAAGSASAKQRQCKNPSFLERSKLSDATIDTLQTELPQSIERQMDEFMSNMAQEAELEVEFFTRGAVLLLA
jgi:hypothetical protein